jgi:hypothetical protein
LGSAGLRPGLRRSGFAGRGYIIGSGRRSLHDVSAYVT